LTADSAVAAAAVGAVAASAAGLELTGGRASTRAVASTRGEPVSAHRLGPPSGTPSIDG